MGMGPVKQSFESVLSKFKIIQNRNYYSTTQSLVYSFISKLSRIFKVEMTGFRPITESGMREPGFTSNHYLIVGLGNYGFDNTRHSVGFKAVDALATRLNIKWGKNGSIGTTKLNHIRLTLFKPKALMNVNGRSVARIANQLSIKPAEVYLIHDELDRVPGKFHLKEGGSAGDESSNSKQNNYAGQED
ncbi:peptidyl-tRNA hydrolase protein 1 [Bulinus truncatus]|nr:peptidyl-tRNA hydrolase protein 1 [Bulinus truncatus]